MMENTVFIGLNNISEDTELAKALAILEKRITHHGKNASLISKENIGYFAHRYITWRSMHVYNYLNSMCKRLLDYNPFYLCIGMVFLYSFPYFYLGENSYIHLHDNLEANVVWYHLVTKMPYDPIGGVLPQIMGGLPLKLLPWKIDAAYQIFNLFPTYYAYILNELLIRIIGFVGMFLVLKNHLLNSENNFEASTTALLFALIPIYPIYGLSVMGIPIIIYSFLNLDNKKLIFPSLLILAAIPFYSSLILSGLFIIALSTPLVVVRFYTKRNWLLLAGYFLLCLSYFISHLPLFEAMIFPSDFVSHRHTWSNVKEINIGDDFKRAIKTIIYGQRHASKINFHAILASLIILPFLTKRLKTKINVAAKLILALFITTSILRILSPYLELLLGSLIPFLASLHLDRFSVLLPGLAFCCFAISLSALRERGQYFLVILFISSQTFYLIKSFHQGTPQYFQNIAKVFQVKQKANLPSYSQFFAQDLFDLVKERIDKPLDSFKVVSLGLHPSIAQYNGFYTLDAYLANYPLENKLSFRKIISEELEKSPNLKEYYDQWGSRCYIFSHQLGRNYSFPKWKNTSIEQLHINANALKELGGTFLISSVKIEKPELNNLQFIDHFETNESFWRIFLYRVN